MPPLFNSPVHLLSLSLPGKLPLSYKIILLDNRINIGNIIMNLSILTNKLIPSFNLFCRNIR